jgi:hypothetical protein
MTHTDPSSLIPVLLVCAGMSSLSNAIPQWMQIEFRFLQTAAVTVLSLDENRALNDLSQIEVRMKAFCDEGSQRTIVDDTLNGAFETDSNRKAHNSDAG